MVQGCSAGFGLGNLVPVKGKVTATAYKFILDNYMLPSLWQQLGKDPLLFQHDCTPLHRVRSTNTWFDEFGVEKLQWPTQRPEL